MKYYLIAGEASGDLHASHLIAALKREDPEAEFRGFGGDLMQAAGMTLVRHYRDLAFMGIVAVVLHARTILAGLRQCREDLVSWRPDVVILVDYPGFNLKIAKFVHDWCDPATGQRGLCPVYYYIAPKIWAWKERRIKEIRRNVDELFSILPFEIDFFEKKHHYPIHYVGNPTVDEVAAFQKKKEESESPSSPERQSDSSSSIPHPSPFIRHSSSSIPHSSFVIRHSSPSTPFIALLCGSRTHEIRDNLPRMLAAAEPFTDRYRLVIAGAPNIQPELYQKYMGNYKVEVVYGQTFDLLSHATAALVTSGTATLETALFRVPQVVCYFMQFRHLVSFLRPLVIKVPYISLVNLIAGKEVVPELVSEKMNAKTCREHLATILPGGSRREEMLRGYDEMARRLGAPGAPQKAAKGMISCLKKGR